MPNATTNKSLSKISNPNDQSVNPPLLEMWEIALPTPLGQTPLHGISCTAFVSPGYYSNIVGTYDISFRPTRLASKAQCQDRRVMPKLRAEVEVNNYVAKSAVAVMSGDYH